MIIALVLFLAWVSFTEAILVCDNYDSYDHPDMKHCSDNKDAERNITEITSNWGFTAEEYTVYTKDGYQISIFRAYSNITQKNPILLGHGILINALSWVYRRKRSLAYHFGTKGYDIWMINFRGIIHSKGHQRLANNVKEYWSFSFHEMGIQDLSSALDLISAKTRRKSIYIGFSMGSTASFVYGSKLPDRAKNNLKGIISLGPVAYLTNIKSIAKYAEPFRNLLKMLIYGLFNGEFHIPPSIAYHICGLYSWQMETCLSIRSLVVGEDYTQIDPLDVPLIFAALLDSTGAEVLSHFAQILRSGEFREKDFGVPHNKRKYGEKFPPKYELSQIPVPVFLIVGNNDWLATVENAEKLYDGLNKDSRSGFKILDYKKFTHNDFIEAKDVVDLLYGSIQEAIHRFQDL